MRPLSLLLIALANLCLVLPASAGPGVWTSAGPESGSVVEIEVDPTDPSRVFLNGANGAIYRSIDTGATWTPLNVAPHAGRFTSLRMSPHDAGILAVTSHDRVFRTLDGGASWAALGGGLPAPGATTDLAFDPHTPGRLWAADAAKLFVSLDDGTTWAAQPTTGLVGTLIYLAADPHMADRLFGYAVDDVGGTDGVFRSTDGGATWAPVGGLGGAWLSFGGSLPIAFTATPGTILLAINAVNIARSVDGGATFTDLGVIGLANARTIRAIEPHPTVAATWFVALETGLARTTDGGATYTAIGHGIRPAAGGYNNGVHALYVGPGAPDTLYAGAFYTGFFVSTDGGVSWLRRNAGIRQAEIRALAVHPAQPLWVYAGYGDAFTTPSDGLFRSVDRGASWFTASPTLEASGLRDIAMDPNTTATPFSTTIYAAGYGAPLQALGGSDRDGNAGIFKSIDGGATWATIDNGIPSEDLGGVRQSLFRTARSVALDRSSGGAPGGTGPLQTLYLAGSGTIRYDTVTGVPTVHAARIYKSVDAGANWTASDTGLPIPDYDTSAFFAHTVQAVQLAVDPTDTDTLYVGTFVNVPGNGGGIPEPRISQGVVNGVFKSIDGGATWAHSSAGLPPLVAGDPDSPTRSVLALALAPSAPATLYASVNRDLFDARIYKSTNGGGTWTQASSGIAPDADIRALIVDPADADVVYAGSTGSAINPGGVYRTIDGGASWTSYSVGLPSSAALALALDGSGTVPRLYAGTRNGVFSIDQVPDEDTDGVPTTIETGAPGGGDGNGDGVPDTVQSRVASLPGAGDAARGGDDYVAVELVPVTGPCARLENTHALPADSFPPDPGREALHGLLRMDIGDCLQAQLRLTYHGVTFDNASVFRIYAPLTPDQTYTYAWRDFPATRSGNVWTINLTDNALGDLRAADGAILFQGGVVRSEVIFGNGFEMGQP
jgi:photosystem II stability/assembly factor-like uncharacterized protein